eukprot:m.150402 g.150402  ORF g.150402 m.150402 type:complete len:865 (+) comp11682_c4_seq7:270-2864(+)
MRHQPTGDGRLPPPPPPGHGAAAAASTPSLPHPWVQGWSKRENRPYFTNTQTGESVWHVPTAPTPHVSAHGEGRAGQEEQSHGRGTHRQRSRSPPSASDQRPHKRPHYSDCDNGGSTSTSNTKDSRLDHREPRQPQRPAVTAAHGDHRGRPTHEPYHAGHHRPTTSVSTGGPGAVQGGSMYRPHTSSHNRAPRANVGKTYLPLMEQMNPEVLAHELGPEWTAVDMDTAFRDRYVDLVFLDGFKNFERRLWKLQCGVKSRIEAHSLSIKTNLHKLLTRHCPGRFIPETHVLPRHTRSVLPDGVWIFRPERKEGSGAGIAVVTTQAELDDAVRADRRDDPRGRIDPIISRYIDRPLLLETDGHSYKFHMRIYYLVVVYPDRRRNRAALFYNGELARAMQPYKPMAYQDKSAHDTHLSDSFKQARPLAFPGDFPGDKHQSARVFRDMHTCLTEVTRLTVPDLAPYKECRDGGFNLFGCDFMVDQDFNVLLLEINGTPGLQRKGFGDAVYQAFSRFIIQGIAEFALTETSVEASRLAHVVPCNEEGVKLLANDDDCAALLEQRTADYAKAIATSHMSSLVGAAKGAKKTLLVDLGDVDVDAAFCRRVESAGWKCLSVVEAFSTKSVTAMLVMGHATSDKRLKRVRHEVATLMVGDSVWDAVHDAPTAVPTAAAPTAAPDTAVPATHAAAFGPPLTIDGYDNITVCLLCAVVVSRDKPIEMAVLHNVHLQGNRHSDPVNAQHDTSLHDKPVATTTSTTTTAPLSLPSIPSAFDAEAVVRYATLHLAHACRLLDGHPALALEVGVSTGVVLARAVFEVDTVHRVRHVRMASSNGSEFNHDDVAAAVCHCALGVPVTETPLPFTVVGAALP